jgi:hypothetical protein
MTPVWLEDTSPGSHSEPWTVRVGLRATSQDR